MGRPRGATLALGAALALAAGLTGCSAAATDPAATGSTTLDVYLGLPLQGPRAAESQAIAEGAKLALARVGGRVGPFTVKLAVLDDSTRAAGGWDRDATAGAARTALEDRTTVAYIGDGDAGATAISLPLTNAAGILHVAPRTTWDGLTQGRTAEDLRPSGRQTLVRVAPRDASGQLQALRALEATCREPLRVAEPGATPVLDAAQPIRADDPISPARIDQDPDCVVVAARPRPDSARLLDQLHVDFPAARLIATDAAGVPGVLSELDRGTQRRLRVVTALPRPTPAFAAAFRRAFGRRPAGAEVLGDAAMRRVLDAIARAGAAGGNRAAVVRAATSAPGVDAAGDAPASRWSVARVADGALTRLTAAPGAPGR